MFLDKWHSMFFYSFFRFSQQFYHRCHHSFSNQHNNDTLIPKISMASQKNVSDEKVSIFSNTIDW